VDLLLPAQQHKSSATLETNVIYVLERAD